MLRNLQAPIWIPNTGEGMILQPTRDVHEWDTLRSPEDDIHGALLAELHEAIKHGGAELYSSQFAFTDADIASCFEVIGRRNDASRFLFDSSQETRPAEAKIVKALCAALQPAQWAIGTSSKARQILHTKAVVILYPDGGGWTMSGSFNFTKAAESQFNIVDVVRSRSRANLFASWIDGMFKWVKTHEGENQP